MSFTSKNLQSRKGGMGFIKSATLFFLGMSCIFFLARAFEIVPITPNAIQYISQIFLTASGDNQSATGIILDGVNGDGRFNGKVDIGNPVTTYKLNVDGFGGFRAVAVGSIGLLGGLYTTGGYSIAACDGNSGVCTFGISPNMLVVDYISGSLGVGTTTPNCENSDSNGCVDFQSKDIYIHSEDLSAMANAGVGYDVGAMGGSGTLVVLNSVGIGMNNPLYSLHVNGNAGIVNTLFFGPILSLGQKPRIFNQAGILNVKGGDTAFSPGPGLDIHINGGDPAGGAAMGDVILTNEGGEVGVGTTNPTEDVQVQNYAWIGRHDGIETGGSFLRLWNTEYGKLPNSNLGYVPNIQLNFYHTYQMTGEERFNRMMAGDTNLNFNFATGDYNYATFMKITPEGKVGIGDKNRTPGPRLDVNGGIRPITVYGNTAYDPCQSYPSDYPEGTQYYNKNFNSYCFCNANGRGVLMQNPTGTGANCYLGGSNPPATGQLETPSMQ